MRVNGDAFISAHMSHFAIADSTTKVPRILLDSCTYCTNPLFLRHLCLASSCMSFFGVLLFLLTCPTPKVCPPCQRKIGSALALSTYCVPTIKRANSHFDRPPFFLTMLCCHSMPRLLNLAQIVSHPQMISPQLFQSRNLREKRTSTTKI